MNSIGSASSAPLAIQQAVLMNKIGVALLAKTQETQQLMGQTAVKLIRAAGQMVNDVSSGNRLNLLA